MKDDRRTRILVCAFSSILIAMVFYMCINTLLGYPGWKMLSDLFTSYHGNLALIFLFITSILGILFGFSANNLKRAAGLGVAAGILGGGIFFVFLFFLGSLLG